MTPRYLAGLTLSFEGYELAVLDAVADVPSISTTPGTRLAEIVQVLRSLRESAGGALSCIVRSTDGMLEGPLLEAGFDVLRYDVAEGELLGSAAALVARGLALMESATRLDLREGFLFGRLDQYHREIAECAGEEAGYSSAGLVSRSREGSGGKTVHLTFDDGPDPDLTPSILDILKSYEATATFFCVGANAREHPLIVERIHAEGHTVGNHSWSHPFVPDLSADHFARQVSAAGDVLTAATGSPVRLFRPPYGSRTRDSLAWSAALDVETVLWDTDSLDWSKPGPDKIVEACLGGVHPGAIVLLHDAGGDRSQTVEALPRILEGLLAAGYAPLRLTRAS